MKRKRQMKIVKHSHADLPTFFTGSTLWQWRYKKEGYWIVHGVLLSEEEIKQTKIGRYYPHQKHDGPYYLD